MSSKSCWKKFAWQQLAEYLRFKLVSFFSSFFALNAGRKSLPCNNLLLLALKTYELRPTFFPLGHQATDEEDGVGDHGGSDKHDN